MKAQTKVLVAKAILWSIGFTLIALAVLSGITAGDWILMLSLAGICVIWAAVWAMSVVVSDGQ